MTPLLVLLGIPPAVAVASEANHIVGSSLSGTIGHLKRKAVDIKLGNLLLIGGVIGSFVGIGIFNSLIKIGNLQLKVIYTPGHYFDSICYFVENVLFTGDTLFVGRTGRTVSQNSDVNDLYDSIYNKILRLPPDTYIYPGHDYGEAPSITIEKNIKISKLLQAKNKKEFIKRMADYEKNRKIGS